MPPVRRLAVEALGEVASGGKKPKEALAALPSLSGRDRAFLMEIVYGSIRYKDTLDWILGRFLKKPGGLPAFTINNLRAGAYQIFYMRVPEWAAVNEAVSLETSKAPVVNAVLRSALRQKAQIESELADMRKMAADPGASDSARVRAISTFASHPAWLVKRWLSRLGAKETLALCDANNSVPNLTLRVNPLKTGREEALLALAGLGIKAKRTYHSPDGIALEGLGNFRELAGILPAEMSCALRAQDEAAQLVSRLLDPKPGQRVLDACSAPGGKATHMAELMADKGEIVAVELSPERARTLRESAVGYSSIKIIEADASELGPEVGLFDCVMLDAPCSATGVIRRNPDVKYVRKEGDLSVFHERQTKLIKGVSRLLKSGGSLVYATCSMEPEEGEEVVEGFLKTSEDFYMIKADAHSGYLRDFLSDGFMRTYPHRHGMDGFFCAKLVRR